MDVVFAAVFVVFVFYVVVDVVAVSFLFLTFCVCCFSFRPPQDKKSRRTPSPGARLRSASGSPLRPRARRPSASPPRTRRVRGAATAAAAAAVAAAAATGVGNDGGRGRRGDIGGGGSSTFSSVYGDEMVVSTASPSSPRSPLRAVKTPSPPSTPTSQLRSPQSLDSTAGMLGSPTGSYGGDRSPFRSAAPELGLQGLREPLPTTAVAAAAASGSCAGAGAAVGGAGAGDGTVGSGGIYSSSSSRRAGGKGQTIITATALATGAAATTSATGDMVTASVADDVTRKNSLGSLLISSPGKDYWAGRIAAGEGSPRDSQRPHTTTGKRIKRRLGRGGGASLSPHRRGWDALSPGGRPPEKQPAGNGGSWMGKGPSLSPARVDRQGAAPRLAGSSAAWSSHAFLSPTRLPNSPLGGTAALSPSSDRVGAGGAGRFEFGAGRKPQLAAGLRSKEPLSPLGSGHALSPIGRVRRAVSASTGQDWDSGGSLNLNNRVKVTVSPMGDPSGSGFGKGGGRSVSPMQRQVRGRRGEARRDGTDGHVGCVSRPAGAGAGLWLLLLLLLLLLLRAP